MASAAQRAQEFIRTLKDHDMKYTEVNDHLLTLLFGGENIHDLRIFVDFDADGESAHFVGAQIISANDGKEAAVILACNEVNHKFRWVKFYLDDDRDVMADCDIPFRDGYVGEVCFEEVLHLVSVIDDAYPILMKANWSDAPTTKAEVAAQEESAEKAGLIGRLLRSRK